MLPLSCIFNKYTAWCNLHCCFEFLNNICIRECKENNLVFIYDFINPKEIRTES